jgi:hypothetical protein
MTAEIKANEILNALYKAFPNKNEMDFYESFIQESAIKIIKEIIYELTDHIDRDFSNDRISWWQQVILEIN